MKCHLPQALITVALLFLYGGISFESIRHWFCRLVATSQLPYVSIVSPSVLVGLVDGIGGVGGIGGVAIAAGGVGKVVLGLSGGGVSILPSTEIITESVLVIEAYRIQKTKGKLLSQISIIPLSPNIHKQILQTDLYIFP